jgi:TRAP-type C4-dicarboxylate transport system permease small subunit
MLEVWSLGVCVLLSMAFAFYSAKLAFDSRAFNDISTGNDATPLWIPQLSMAIGTLVLAIAFIDEFVQELRGRRVSPGDGESLRNE